MTKDSSPLRGTQSPSRVPATHWLPGLITSSLLALLVCDASARTWRVARDGPADFSTIQPALDAASPGDTMWIGTGEYLEYQTVTPPGWPVAIKVYGYVHDDSLTILGDRLGTPVIGPRAPDFTGYSPVGFLTGQGFFLRLRRLTLRNLNDGTYIGSGHVEITECSFEGCAGALPHSVAAAWTVAGFWLVNRG